MARSLAPSPKRRTDRPQHRRGSEAFVSEFVVACFLEAALDPVPLPLPANSACLWAALPGVLQARRHLDGGGPLAKGHFARVV
jgi:hypothetical protein